MIQSFKITQTHCGVKEPLIPPTFVRNHHNAARSRISFNPVLNRPRHLYPIQKRKSSLIRAAAASGSSSTPKNNNASGAGRNIVIAVDTSPASKASCHFAIEQLIRPGDVVHLAHCIPSFPTQGLYTLPDGRLAVVNFQKLLHSENEYLKAAKKVVSEWAWEIFHPENIPFVVNVIKEQEALTRDKHGIARLLCQKAKELNAAALIICPHTHGGLGELLMGSVAADCGRYSETPVVVLHEPSHNSGTGKKKTTAVTWLTNLVVRELGHPDTVDTAAEVIAQSVANGPLHTGRNSTSKKVESSPSSSSASTSEAEDRDTNLIGQVVGEVPGTDMAFSTPHRQNQHHSTGEKQKKGRAIVIAVDDSEQSSHAAAWAAHHMYRQGDTLHLVHVIPSLPSVAYGSGPMAGLSSSFLYVLLEPPTAAYKEATQKYMEERFHGMLRSAGVNFTSDILLEMTDGGVDGVGHALLDKAEELGASALVVGSQHSGGIGEFLLGSVGQWLAHHSLKIPVVILH